MLQPSDWLGLLRTVLHEAALPHALIGGQAVVAWSIARSTDDYDFIVAADRDGIARVQGGLEAAGLHVSRTQNPTASSGPDFVQLRSDVGGLQVDLQTAKTDFQAGIIERAVPDAEHGISVATPEDLVVLKLLAMRSQDQRDIAVLTATLGDEIDWPYVEHWAAIWDVTHALRTFHPA